MRKPFAAFSAAAALLLVFSWVYLPTLTRYRDLKLQEDEIERQVRQLEGKIADLREERDLLKNDKEYLEKVIRDQLGLVKPGETVYKFVPEEPPPPAPPPQEEAAEQPDAAPPAEPVVVPPAPAVPAVKPAVIPVKSTIPEPTAPFSSRPAPVYPRRETR